LRQVPGLHGDLLKKTGRHTDTGVVRRCTKVVLTMEDAGNTAVRLFF
jgi:hypothetical protein